MCSHMKQSKHLIDRFYGAHFKVVGVWPDWRDCFAIEMLTQTNWYQPLPTDNV